MKKLLLSTLLTFSLYSQCQVFTAGTHYSNYYDIVPDTLLNYVNYPFTNETYSLTIFGSSNPELAFTARGSVSSGGSQAFIRLTTLHQYVYIRFGRWDSVYVPGSQSWNVTKIAKPLTAGDTINASGAIWEQGDLYLTDHTGSQGGNKNVNDFVGGDKYIGLKFIDIDNYNAINYGWIWVKCIGEDSCYVKEYSRSASVTGLNATGKENDLQIFPNPIQEYFYLQNVDYTGIRITDILGVDVPFTIRNYSDKTQILVKSDLPAGYYFLQVKIEDKVVVKKLTKSN
jgi:hypothetical protein